MVTLPHFQPELALVKIEDNRRSQVLTGAVQGTDPISLAIDRIYAFQWVLVARGHPKRTPIHFKLIKSFHQNISLTVQIYH